MKKSPVALCGTLDIHAGEADPLRVFLEAEARVVRTNEPATIDFCFFFNESRTVMRWFESYLDATAFATHMQAVHEREFLDTLTEFGALRNLDVFGHVDDLARGILDALGARYWDRVAGFDRTVGHMLV